MKANELMIGDWVMLDGKEPKQITGLKTHSCKHGYVQIKNIDCSAEYLEPIPLTPEILEKNGWYHAKFHGSYGRQAMRIDGCYQDELPKGVDNALCFAQWSIDKKFMYHFLEIFMWVGSIHLKIEYVHELQHALRLCGIEKEIKL